MKKSLKQLIVLVRTFENEEEGRAETNGIRAERLRFHTAQVLATRFSVKVTPTIVY